MSRRHRAERRQVIPDAKYGDEVLSKFMNSLMLHGKKSTAERDAELEALNPTPELPAEEGDEATVSADG